MQQQSQSIQWSSLVLLALIIWTLLGLFWMIQPWGDSASHLLVENIIQLPPLLLIAAFFWRAAHKRARDDLLRRSLVRLGAAFLLHAIGEAIWLGYAALNPEQISLHMILIHLVHTPLLLWALLTIPGGLGFREVRAQFWLDAAVAVLASWILIWHYILGPIAGGIGTDPMTNLTLLANPLVEMVLVAASITVLVRLGNHPYRFSLLALGIGLLVGVLADLVYGYQMLHGAFGRSGWAGALWLLSHLMIAGGAHHAEKHGGAPAIQREYRALHWSADFPPYVAVLTTCGLLLLTASRVKSRTVFELLLGLTALLVLVLIRQAITSRENARLQVLEKMVQNEHRLGALMKHATDLITVVSRDGTIRYQSPSSMGVLGSRPAELEGRSILRMIHPEDRAAVQKFFQALVDQTGGADWIRLRFAHRDGSWRQMQAVANNLLRDPDVQGVVLNARDVTEELSLREQATYHELHDPVTGLENRVGFTLRLEGSLKAAEAGGECLSILLLNLDGFKNINESLGPLAGDQVLRVIAARLRSSVGGSDAIARMGGAEFAVILRGSGEEQVNSTADRLLRAVRTPMVVEGRTITVTANIGIARREDGGSKAEELLHSAGVAHFLARGDGKDRYVVFRPGMHHVVQEQVEFGSRLHQALLNQEFLLHYQPIFDRTGQHLCGVEALVRWQDAAGKMVPPGQFIPAAEQSGLIIPLGNWILSEACQQAKQWLPESSRFSVGINISPEQLLHPDFVSTFERTLASAGVPGSHLTLELTETVLLAEHDDLLSRLAHLKSLGVSLALDDFGTGYSSLSYLRRFPFDLVKIDQSFVQELDDRPQTRAVVRGIIDLARALDLQTVAEGVETEGQLALLQELQCDRVQGFLLSRPVDAAAISRRLGPDLSHHA